MGVQLTKRLCACSDFYIGVLVVLFKVSLSVPVYLREIAD